VRPKLLGLALALAALIPLAGAFTRPSPPALSTTITGDADLAAQARPLLPGALDRVSIAVVDGSTVAYANFGANEETEYEIGSITKTFTGLLLADAIERGEVTVDTKLGALLPLAGAPVADVTLAELASHRSGLSAQDMQLDEMYVYSNLGTALLGHALAAAARRDYVILVQQRVLTPLGMSATTLPLTAKDFPTDAPLDTAPTALPKRPGRSTAGRPRGRALDARGHGALCTGAPRRRCTGHGRVDAAMGRSPGRAADRLRLADAAVQRPRRHV
jgi:CubicO group peptidase (beta-lactamase class C family)